MTKEVEDIFKRCVRGAGGRCLDDELPGDPGFRNADFVFDEFGVVAELKCLERDIFRTPAFQEKVKQLHDKWVADGLILPTNKFNLRDIPEGCAIEYLGLIKRQLRDSYFKSANDQIKTTKAQMGLDDYKGLLIIANEGNTLLTPSALFNVMHHSFNGGSYSQINRFILVNASMLASMPGQESFYYWFAPKIRGREDVPEKLITNLSEQWGEKVSDWLGVELPSWTISAPNIGLVDSIDHKK